VGFTIGKLIYIAWTVFEEKNYEATDVDLDAVREIIKRRLQEIEARIITELNV